MENYKSKNGPDTNHTIPHCEEKKNGKFRVSSLLNTKWSRETATKESPLHHTTQYIRDMKTEGNVVVICDTVS